MVICVKNLAAIKVNASPMANGACGRGGKLVIRRAGAEYRLGNANAMIRHQPTMANIALVLELNHESVLKLSVRLMGLGASGFSGAFAQVFVIAFLEYLILTIFSFMR